MTSPASPDRSELFALVAASASAYADYQSALLHLQQFTDNTRELCFENPNYVPGINYAHSYASLSGIVAECYAVYCIAAGRVQRLRQTLGDI